MPHALSSNRLINENKKETVEQQNCTFYQVDYTWQEKHREELALMVQCGKRAEIEALYFHGYDYLGKYIAKKIVQANYI